MKENDEVIKDSDRLSNCCKAELYTYEYRFNSTPEYQVVDEPWELYDVFLKHLHNGYPIFVTVFRRKCAPSEL